MLYDEIVGYMDEYDLQLRYTIYSYKEFFE